MNIEKIRIFKNNIKKNIREHILKYIKTNKIYLFTGVIGSGKTTIIKEIAKNINKAIDPNIVQSPYFNIIKNYNNILHSDVTKNINYFKTVIETIEIKRPEYIFVEYADNIDKILHLLNTSYCYINIDINIINKQTRDVFIHYI